MKTPPKITTLRKFLKANNIPAKTLAFAFHEQCDIQSLFDLGFIHVEDKRVEELEERLAKKDREIAELKIEIVNLQAAIEEMKPYDTHPAQEQPQKEAITLFDDGKNKFTPYRAFIDNMERWVYDVKSDISNNDESDIDQVRFTDAYFTDDEMVEQIRTHLSTCYNKWHYVEEYDDNQEDIYNIKQMLRDKLTSKLKVEGTRKKLITHALLITNIKLDNDDYKEYHEVLSDISEVITVLVREHMNNKFTHIERPKAKATFDEAGIRCEIDHSYHADMSISALDV